MRYWEVITDSYDRYYLSTFEENPDRWKLIARVASLEGNPDIQFFEDTCSVREIFIHPL